VKYVAVFVATYLYVMARAFQQRNVAFDNYAWIPAASTAMAILDVFIVSTVAREGWHIALVASCAAAGTLGCWSAMAFHKRFVKR
jgi:hypothetical protein